MGTLLSGYHRIRLLGIDFEFRGSRADPFCLKFAVQCEAVQRGERDVVRIHLEERPQVFTSVAPSAGTVPVTVGIKLDSLTVVTFFMVAFVAFWIFVFSLGYMSGHSDEIDGLSKYSRFFAYLSLFGFSMLGLVVSSSLLFLFICWELVGLCSYFLIG